VHGADQGPLQHPGVTEGLGQHRRRAGARPVGAADGRLAEADDADDLGGRAREQRDRHRGDGEADDDGGDLHLMLLLG